MTKLKRWTSSILIASVALMLFWTSNIAYADDLKGREFEADMREMVKEGVLHGYPDGSFKPTEKVTRGQFAAFIERALTLPKGKGSFKDVGSNVKLKDSILAVSHAGIMSGYTDNNFKPNDYITREQMALTMQAVLEYSGMPLDVTGVDIADRNAFGSSTYIRAAFTGLNYKYLDNVHFEETRRFEPKADTTREQSAGAIARFLKAKKAYEEENGPTTPPVPTPPPADPNAFQMAAIKNGKLEKTGEKYTDYLKAATAYNSSSSSIVGLYKGNELIRIKSGLAYGNNTVSKDGKRVAATTIIYADPEFKTQATYTEYGRELRYIDANEKFVKVQAGGTIGYAKHSEVDFIPYGLITNREYYMVSQYGTLNHYTVNHANGSRNLGAYPIGAAPSWMKQGVKYYSHDGVHYSNLQGQHVGTHYPYFQFLSVRSKSNYTAKELDSYIAHRLQEISVNYPTAPKTSKLIGLGSYIKKMEEEHNVNALFILSAAIHESNAGMSANAQQKNNLFGIQVYDSSPEAGEKYAKLEASIDAFVNRYVNERYTPNGTYAKGAAAGNKTTGMNVHYASDPNWGSKIASHMWRADNQLGGKDIGKYQLAMTGYNGQIHVRRGPSTSEAKVFSYNAKSLGVNDAFGYPLVIVDEVKGSDGFTWFKVLSDDAKHEFGWIREVDGNLQLVKKITAQ